MPLARVSLTLAADDAPLALAVAGDALGAGCRETVLPDGRVTLDAWVPRARAARVAGDAAAALGAASVAASVAVEDEDDSWRHAMLAFHKPVEIAGRLLVRPPWEPPRPGLADVVVDPGMAFGTGQHATTRGCLALLAALPPGPLVDVGCGSGILAIAARRLGHDPVWALDADPLAVEATIANARANGVGLVVARRDLARDRLPAAETVLANLTATLLRTLAGALAAAPPRAAVLSGLRVEEAPDVLAAFAPLGLRERDRVEEEGWAAIRVGR
ncbi:MAG: 50S ribosomal protein L11 methyltransferase [Actinomycetota bacterium]